MLAYASAILLLTLNSALAAPLSSSRLLNVAPVVGTHTQMARNPCPAITKPFLIVYKGSQGRIQAGEGQLEGANCVRPIIGGWRGVPEGDAFVVTSLNTLPADIRKFDQYKATMALTGDVGQSSAPGSNWLIIDRPGMNVKDTTRWKKFMMSSYDAKRPREADKWLCKKEIQQLHQLVLKQLETYASSGLSYTYLTSDDILFSDNWETVRFIPTPTVLGPSSDDSEEAEMRAELIQNLDIQVEDTMAFDGNLNQVKILGTCKTAAWVVAPKYSKYVEKLSKSVPATECVCDHERLLY